MRILIIASNYPSKLQPYAGAFVQKFAQALSRSGATCTVLNPFSAKSLLADQRYCSVKEEVVRSDKPISLHRIPVVPLTTRVAIPSFRRANPYEILQKLYLRSVTRYIENNGIEFDVVYGHFLAPAGIAAVELGLKYSKPSFVGVGEGRFHTLRGLGVKRMAEKMANATGFIAVSTAIRNELVRVLKIKQEKIGVFPNGVELDLFSNIDRATARAKFGLNDDCFAISAIGSFNHNKGISRVAEAIDGIPGVVGLYAGAGLQPPIAANNAFCSTLPPSEIPYLLAASDVFVLPTLIEGCCNAIVEAIASGLPIISSNGDFNDDLLDPRMSIRVDPLDINGIRSAVLELMHNEPLRRRMSDASRDKSANFNIDKRVEHILEFMYCA